MSGVGAVVEDVDIAEMAGEIIAALAPPPGFVVDRVGEMSTVRPHRIPVRVVLQNLIAKGLKHHDRSNRRIAVAIQAMEGM